VICFGRVTKKRYRKLSISLAFDRHIGRRPEESVMEIRPLFEAEDFGEEFTPELREQEERLRAQAEQLQKKKA
jgi:hypothetical protein